MQYKDTFSNLLKHPPLSYVYYIEQTMWEYFVTKILTPEWEVLRKLQQERRAKSTNLRKLFRMDYVGLQQKMEKELGHELTEFDRGDLWTRAWLNEKGEYMNEEVKKIADKIVSLLKFMKILYMYDSYKLICLNYFLGGWLWYSNLRGDFDRGRQ